MKTNFRYSFFAILLVAGCVKDATHVKLPETKAKLVVGCFISASDTVIKMEVSQSNPIFGSNHNKAKSLLVSNAVVTISDGSITKNLIYNSNEEVYELKASSFPIIAGQTYSVDVKADGLDEVLSSCTVPLNKVSVGNLEIKKGINSNTLEVKWNDITGERNYYRILVQYVAVDSIAKDTIYQDATFGTNVFSDADYQDKEMTAVYDSYLGLGSTSNFGYYVYAMDLYILNIDVNYYNYYSSIDKYTYDDPFAEPSPIFTNVKNGLGLFGAYKSFYFRKI